MDPVADQTAGTFSFAFLSDPHLPPPPEAWGMWPMRLKPHLGRQSWRRKRHLRHRPEVLAALLDDVALRGTGHLVVGGDLVNFADPAEFAAARDWLAGLGAAGDVTVVPGNHDAYTPLPAARGLDLWAPWLAGDDDEGGFPALRVRGPVAFVCLSTAVPKPPLLATGTLGAAQIAAAEAMLAEAGARGLCRVVVLHHPPTEAAAARKALTDRVALRRAIRRAGAELVLHGHLHSWRVDPMPGPDGAVPVIGVPSASMRREAPKGDPAGWLQVDLAGGADGWSIVLTMRGLEAEGFATRGRLQFTVQRH